MRLRMVIGGLITSTALTLIVVPVAFTLADDLKTATLQLLARLHASATREDPGASAADGR